MTKVFLDSDVIIDFLAKRAHYPEAFALLAIIEEGKVIAYTSPIVLANVDYITAKYSTKAKSRKAIRILRKKISILPVNGNIVDKALESEFTDFEDAIQYYAAESEEVDFIVTRNKKDYAKGKLKVVTAQEFLELFQASEEKEEV